MENCEKTETELCKVYKNQQNSHILKIFHMNMKSWMTKDDTVDYWSIEYPIALRNQDGFFFSCQGPCFIGVFCSPSSGSAMGLKFCVCTFWFLKKGIVYWLKSMDFFQMLNFSFSMVFFKIDYVNIRVW